MFDSYGPLQQKTMTVDGSSGSSGPPRNVSLPFGIQSALLPLARENIRNLFPLWFDSPERLGRRWRERHFSDVTRARRRRFWRSPAPPLHQAFSGGENSLRASLDGT